MSRARQLQLLQHEVASAVLSGAGADQVERRVIAPSSCSEDDKTALRLYAFSFLPRFEQRRIALDRLRAARQEEARLGPPAARQDVRRRRMGPASEADVCRRES